MRIATGEGEEEYEAAREQKAESARRAGLKGGKARAEALTPRQRAEIASAAARARWKK